MNKRDELLLYILTELSNDTVLARMAVDELRDELTATSQPAATPPAEPPQCHPMCGTPHIHTGTPWFCTIGCQVAGRSRRPVTTKEGE